MQKSLLIFLIALLAFPVLGFGYDPEEEDDLVLADDSELALEEELQWLQSETVVFSASRHLERLFNTTSAIYVITSDDMRRAGIRNLPEALRMAPGVQVGRISSGHWAVTARGFNGQYANKLLVLKDGRSIYTFNYAGVFWEAQDLMIDNIERIEIIRGPGASLWGANAVNGIINIITKKTEDSQGGLVSTGFGEEDRQFNIRYGDQLSDNLKYRIYTKGFSGDSFKKTPSDLRNPKSLSENDRDDSWKNFRSGFRVDWAMSNKDNLFISGELFRVFLNQQWGLYSPEPPSYGGWNFDGTYNDGHNILARWERSYSDNSDLALQLYYDYTDMDMAIFKEKRDTLDIDFQHRFTTLYDILMITWGLGYRNTYDEMENTFTLSYSPENLSYDLFTGFVQNELWAIEEEMKFTLGCKIEHHQYTGYELQPTLRMLYLFSEDFSLWAAASQAKRTPSRINHDMTQVIGDRAPGSQFNPTSLVMYGMWNYNDNIKSEDLKAYELGVRLKPDKEVEFDLSLFLHKYKDLMLYVFHQAPPNFNNDSAYPYLYELIPIENGIDGKLYGGELSANWNMLTWWTLKSALTLNQFDFSYNDSYNGEDYWSALKRSNNSAPGNEFSLRSSTDFDEDFEVNIWFRHVDSVGATDAYQDLDINLVWHPSEEVEFSLSAQNLLFRNRKEDGANDILVDRNYYLQSVFNF
jgi:iron complex outermembrane recepter protein